MAVQNVKNWGSLGRLAVTRSHRKCHHPIERIRFDFNRNYVSSFYRFRYIAGYLSKVADFDQVKFRGRVVLAIVSQCTKFAVSRFTRYEAMNGGAKCRKRGGLVWLEGTQGHRQCHHSIQRIRLSIRL